jgi:hypothetical protein
VRGGHAGRQRRGAPQRGDGIGGAAHLVVRRAEGHVVAQFLGFQLDSALENVDGAGETAVENQGAGQAAERGSIIGIGGENGLVLRLRLRQAIR